MNSNAIPEPAFSVAAVPSEPAAVPSEPAASIQNDPTQDDLRESIRRRIIELEAQNNASAPEKLYLASACPICSIDLFSREAYEPKIAVTQCGHGLCVSCIKQLEQSQYPKCPLCKAHITKFWLITLQDSASQRTLTLGGHQNFGYSAQVQDYNPSQRFVRGGRVNAYQEPEPAFPARMLSFYRWAAQPSQADQPSQAAQLAVSANLMRYSPTIESLRNFPPSSPALAYAPVLEGGAAPASHDIRASYAYVKRPDGAYVCVLQITDYGARVPGSAHETDFLFILDVSGSMSSHYQTIVDIANEAIRNLNPEQGNRMSIIAYASNVLYLSGGLSSSPRLITSEHFGGGTQTEAALRAGIRVLEEARENYPARHAIVFVFSDGDYDKSHIPAHKDGHDDALRALASIRNCEFVAGSLGGNVRCAAFVDPLTSKGKEDCYTHFDTIANLRKKILELCGKPSPSAISVTATIGDTDQVFPQSVSSQDTLLLSTDAPIPQEIVEANTIPRVCLTAPDGTVFEIVATHDPSVGVALEQRFAKDKLTAEINRIHEALRMNPKTEPEALEKLRQIIQTLSREVLGVYLEEIQTLAETTIDAIVNPSISSDNMRVASNARCISQRSRSFQPVPNAGSAAMPAAFSAAASSANP